MPVLSTWGDLQQEMDRACEWRWRWQVHDALARYGLTAREREVVWMLFAGMTNKEIAEAIYLSPDTVKNYLTTAYRKAGVHDRVQLTLRLLGIY